MITIYWHTRNKNLSENNIVVHAHFINVCGTRFIHSEENMIRYVFPYLHTKDRMYIESLEEYCEGIGYHRASGLLKQRLTNYYAKD